MAWSRVWGAPSSCTLLSGCARGLCHPPWLLGSPPPPGCHNSLRPTLGTSRAQGRLWPRTDASTEGSTMPLGAAVPCSDAEDGMH